MNSANKFIRNVRGPGSASLILLTLCGCGTSGSPAVNPNPNFVVWDGTAYLGKPDLTSLGMIPITSLSTALLWGGDGKDTTDPPNPQTISSLLEQANLSKATAFLDIESWPVVSDDPSVVADSVHKYLVTMQSFEQFAPSAKFGFYAVAPIRDYWDAISGPGSAQYIAWQQRNDDVAPIAMQADILFPSIYTFYPDEAGWKKYAIAQIQEARRIAPGKPVYAFLWNQYEVEGTGSNYLPPDYWRMELETVRQYADGVVIWGGYQQNWDPSAPWWQETESFLKELKNHE